MTRFSCFDPDESAYDVQHPRDFDDPWGEYDEDDEDPLDPRLVCECGNDKLSSEDRCAECAEE